MMVLSLEKFRPKLPSIKISFSRSFLSKCSKLKFFAVKSSKELKIEKFFELSLLFKLKVIAKVSFKDHPLHCFLSKKDDLPLPPSTTDGVSFVINSKS